MIALATDRIIMTPGSSIGSAEPRLGLGGQELTDEKIVSALRARFKAIAEEKGHNKALAQAMVDKDVVVKLVRIRGVNYILTEEEIQEVIATYGEDEVEILSTISGKGKLLNLSYKDAEKYGLAEAICKDRETLLAYLGYESPSILEPKPSWSENFVRFITHPVVASLLLGIGFWAIIIALRIPGFGIPEIVGISCILLFFWGHKLAGLAEWLDLLLIAIGIALILIEILLIPGFGITGGLGILALIIGIALTLTKLPLRPFLGGLEKALYITSFSFIIAFILFLLSLKIFPKTKVWKNLVLQTHGPGGIQIPQIEETEGVALSDLRPAGKAKFGSKIYNVETDGEYIEKGTRIKITEIRGNIIKVKRI
jgi:membrane-bound serine protease (ClpP class)